MSACVDYDYCDDCDHDITDVEDQVIDYMDEFANENAVIAQGLGTNFIVIRKLDTPFKRSDGKRGCYELEYRWLSEPCRNEKDQSFVCVQGAEFTYWQRKEIEPLLRQIKRNAEVNVFDHFNLF